MSSIGTGKGQLTTVPSGSGAPLGDQYLVLVNDATLTGCRILTPRDLLLATDGGANGAYNIDFTPNDPTVAWTADEFLCGSISSGVIGELGWLINNVGAAATASQIAGAVPNIGIVRLTTGAAQGNGGVLCLAVSSVGPLGNLQGTAGWDCRWIFRMSGTATIRFRAGFCLGTAANVLEPTDGIWLRYDTSSGFADTDFQVVCRASSTSTVTDTTVAADGNFHKIRIRSDAAGTIKFTLDNGSDLTISTNVPTAAMTPAFIIGTDTTAVRSADVDFFSFKWRGLSR